MSSETGSKLAYLAPSFFSFQICKSCKAICKFCSFDFLCAGYDLQVMRISCVLDIANIVEKTYICHV